MSFNLESAASPNWMGLTANVAGHRALIVGWDGSEYTLELEGGDQIKTADFVWEFDSLADEDTMRSNARLAALRSESSPYNTLGKISFDPFTGSWDGEYLGESLLKLADDLEALSDDEFGGNDEPDQEEDQDFLKELEVILQGLDNQLESGEIAEDDPHLKALPILLGCACHKDLDPSDFGLDVASLFGDGKPERDEHEMEASVQKEAFVGAALAATRLMPYVARGAQAVGLSGVLNKIPGASKAGGLINSGLKSMGISSLLGMGGGGGPQPPPILNSRGSEFGMYSATHHGYADRHFGLTVKQAASKPGDDILEGVRSQVMNALMAAAPNIQDIWGERGDALWWVVQDDAVRADSITALQSILMSLPEEYHNANAIGPSVDEAAPSPGATSLPSPGSKPRAPGGQVPGEPGAGPVAPPGGAAGGPMSLGPGGLGPSGATPPPGTAPGGGIPGGPGRRAPMPALRANVRKATADDFSDFEAELYKVAMPSNPFFQENMQSGAYDRNYAVDEQANAGRTCPECGQPDLMAYPPGEWTCNNCGWTSADENGIGGLDDPDFGPQYASTKQANPYAALGDATQDQTPQVTFGLKENADEKAQLDQAAQQYINQGMTPVQAYGRAAMDLQQAQQQDYSGMGSMAGPATPTAPTTYRPTPPTVASKEARAELCPVCNGSGKVKDENRISIVDPEYINCPACLGSGWKLPNRQAAAGGTGEMPVMQDGHARATLKCPNCSSQTVVYAGDENFRCLNCGTVTSYNLKEDKTAGIGADLKQDLVGLGQDIKQLSPQDMLRRRRTRQEMRAGFQQALEEAIARGDTEQAQSIMSMMHMGSVKWSDTTGNPLEVGKLYKMTMPGVPVPDFVRVTWVEPENIRVAFAANGREDDITEQYEFELVDENDQGQASGLDWLMEGSSSNEPIVDPTRVAGAQFSSQEQRDFIDEEGEARNRDKLNLEGTHYRQSAYDGLTDLRPSNPGRVNPDQFLIG